MLTYYEIYSILQITHCFSTIAPFYLSSQENAKKYGTPTAIAMKPVKAAQKFLIFCTSSVLPVDQ